MIEECATLCYSQRVVRYLMHLELRITYFRHVQCALLVCGGRRPLTSSTTERRARKRASRRRETDTAQARAFWPAGRAWSWRWWCTFLHRHASAGRAYIHVVNARERCERKQVSKQGEVTANDGDGYLGLAQLSVQPQRPTYAAWYTLFKACRTNVRALA